MENHVRRFLAVVAFGFICHIPLATAQQIVGVDVGDHAGVIVRLSENTSCGSPRVYVPNTKPYYKDILSMAYLAHSTGKSVQVYVAQCNYWGDMALIVRMWVGTVW